MPIFPPSDSDERENSRYTRGDGPEATVDLMQRIIRLTGAKDDIDHIHCIVDNNPKIPSRIKAIIEGTGQDPAPELVNMAKRLETAGADFLAIACNTAHTYYPAVAGAVEIPVIHMVKEVQIHLKRHFPDLDRVGVLASPAIEITGLYEAIFTSSGIRGPLPGPGCPGDAFQRYPQGQGRSYDLTGGLGL